MHYVVIPLYPSILSLSSMTDAPELALFAKKIRNLSSLRFSVTVFCYTFPAGSPGALFCENISIPHSVTLKSSFRFVYLFLFLNIYSYFISLFPPPHAPFLILSKIGTRTSTNLWGHGLRENAFSNHIITSSVLFSFHFLFLSHSLPLFLPIAPFIVSFQCSSSSWLRFLHGHPRRDISVARRSVTMDRYHRAFCQERGIGQLW